MKNKRGFTLVELIVVMAVIGVLVLLAMPKFMGYTKEARLTELKSNIKTLEDASERYYINKQDWPRLTEEPYTAEQIESFANEIYNVTGKKIKLDPNGEYYDIDYNALQKYISVPEKKAYYILQNPVGNVYAMDGLTEQAEKRLNIVKLEGISFKDTSVSVELGETYELEVIYQPNNATSKDLKWSSNDESIITVSQNGEVTGMAKGVATITATTLDNKFTAECLVSVVSPFTTATFTNAGATATVGPTQEQLNTAYKNTPLEGQVVSKEGIQLWVVPKTGTYKIQTFGAGGASYWDSFKAMTIRGGDGAIMSGDFELEKGELLIMLVGHAGYQIGYGSAGGGGTYVAKKVDSSRDKMYWGDYVEPLIISGGGSGAGMYNRGNDAIVAESGSTGTDGGAGTGGTGFRGEVSFLNGGVGRNIIFGGGAFRGSGNYLGAGGGYAGGNYNSSNSGFGGSSYNAGENQVNSSSNRGNGKIIITYVGQ